MEEEEEAPAKPTKEEGQGTTATATNTLQNGESAAGINQTSEKKSEQQQKSATVVDDGGGDDAKTDQAGLPETNTEEELAKAETKEKSKLQKNAHAIVKGEDDDDTKGVGATGQRRL